MICFDSDDFGCDHIISDMCQSHDCRDVLIALHEANPAFKATLFAIPFEMTPELLAWSKTNKDWIELAQHGFLHLSNYECEKLTYEEFSTHMTNVYNFTGGFFVKGFKAPGWQISDDIYQWLKDNGWWVADKNYNNDRRPKDLPAYVNYDGNDMRVCYNGIESDDIPATHHHTWNVGWNGVYEQFDYLMDLVKREKEFQFVSEAISEKTKAIEREIRNRG